MAVRELVDGLARDGREGRVIAVMIESADGRTAVEGRSVGLGHPADRELLRTVRAGADAILVGARTLAAERYATLLDDPAGRHPVVATVSRTLDLDLSVPLLAEPDVPVAVYTASEGELSSPGAALAVHRLEPFSLRGVVEHLRAEYGARTISCEGGPALLRELLAEDLVDDVLLTIAPVLVAGASPTLLSGPALEPVRALALQAVHRADDHLFLHYARAR